MKKLLFLSAILFAISSQCTFAQTTVNQTISVIVPDVAKVALTNNTTVTGQLGVPTQAGNPIVDYSTSSGGYYLQYSSIVTGTQQRKITVTTDVVVPGVYFNLTASTPVQGSNLGGNLGVSQITNPIVINTTSQDIITSIGSCYTGVSNTSGSSLIYKLTSMSLTNDAPNYGSLRAGTTPVSVTYTLMDM